MRSFASSASSSGVGADYGGGSSSATVTLAASPSILLARGHVNLPVGAVRHSLAAFLTHPLRWVEEKGGGGRHGAWTCTIMLLQAMCPGERAQ